MTIVEPNPRRARSTPGEAGRAANRQAFASLSYPANRQVLRNPRVGRPGFLMSMSHHPRTAVGPGRHAGLLLTPNCQGWSARSRHTQFTTISRNVSHERLSGQDSSLITGRLRGASAQREWENLLSRHWDGPYCYPKKPGFEPCPTFDLVQSEVTIAREIHLF